MATLAIARWLPFGCLLSLHAPDGSTITLRSEAITAVRPVATQHAPHVAAGVRSVIYMGGVGSGGFGVAEAAPDVLRQIKECR